MKTHLEGWSEWMTEAGWDGDARVAVLGSPNEREGSTVITKREFDHAAEAMRLLRRAFAQIGRLSDVAVKWQARDRELCAGDYEKEGPSDS